MKMEFLDATGGGSYPNASPKRLIRLFDFTDNEKLQFINSVQESVLKVGDQLKLQGLSFIHAINCSITLKLSSHNKGLIATGCDNEYVCLLTRAAYIDMLEIIEHIGDGHNWLTPGEYLDEPAFLISKWGPW